VGGWWRRGLRGGGVGGASWVARQGCQSQCEGGMQRRGAGAAGLTCGRKGSSSGGGCECPAGGAAGAREWGSRAGARPHLGKQAAAAARRGLARQGDAGCSGNPSGWPRPSGTPAPPHHHPTTIPASTQLCPSLTPASPHKHPTAIPASPHKHPTAIPASPQLLPSLTPAAPPGSPAPAPRCSPAAGGATGAGPLQSRPAPAAAGGDLGTLKTLKKPAEEAPKQRSALAGSGRGCVWAWAQPRLARTHLPTSSLQC
jgi:hypothetical protein